MFISLVFNTEYGDKMSRKLFYLQNLQYCYRNGGILVSYEYMHTHFNQLISGISHDLLAAWHIENPQEIVDKVEQYYIPDSLFDTIEDNCGARTEALFQLIEKSDEKLENSFQSVIDTINKRHPGESIEGVFCVQEPLNFIQTVCSRNHIPMIPFFFSAIRKPHGYRETLYYTNLKDNLYSTKEPAMRYKRFQDENDSSLPILSHEELIAFLGKPRTFPLLPFINSEPVYELGVCCEAWSVIPQYFSKERSTDDDIFFQSDRYYTRDKIKVRSHALQLDQIQVDRSFVHNDPASYILSCRRLAAVRSQIILKSLLWGRTSIVFSESLGFSFMCENDVTSTKTVDIKALNWYLFGYLIPHDLMFSHDYWRWRLNNPSESEIYRCHWDFFVRNNFCTYDDLSLTGAERLRALIEKRINDKELIDIVCRSYHNSIKTEIDFDNAISKIVYEDRVYYRINEKLDDGTLRCYITVKVKEGANILFYPFDDVAGFGKLERIIIDKKEISIDMPFIYFEKVKGNIDLTPLFDGFVTGIHNIVIVWRAEREKQFLDNFKSDGFSINQKK